GASKRSGDPTGEGGEREQRRQRPEHGVEHESPAGVLGRPGRRADGEGARVEREQRSAVLRDRDRPPVRAHAQTQVPDLGSGGKLGGGSVRTSGRRSADSPEADPSYATAGIVDEPARTA